MLRISKAIKNLLLMVELLSVALRFEPYLVPLN